MGQTASQIENRIEEKRENLGDNLRELESRVKSATDWRYQFRSHPGIFLGGALGGGMLLARAVGRSSRRSRRDIFSSPRAGISADVNTGQRPARPRSPALENAIHAWGNIKGALVGVAAARVKDYVEKAIPGFDTYYQKTEIRHPM